MQFIAHAKITRGQNKTFAHPTSHNGLIISGIERKETKSDHRLSSG
jgi:hypothetical protein